MVERKEAELLPLAKLDLVFRRASADPETNDQLVESMQALGAESGGSRFFYLLHQGESAKPSEGEKCYHVAVGIGSDKTAVYDFSGPFSFGSEAEKADMEEWRRDPILEITASHQRIHGVMSGEEKPLQKVMSGEVKVEGLSFAKVMRIPKAVNEFFDALRSHYLAVCKEHSSGSSLTLEGMSMV